MDNPEPTIGDVLTELRTMRLEHRADFATVRYELAEIRMRLLTLQDEIASFRAEYNEHTHPDAA